VPRPKRLLSPDEGFCPHVTSLPAAPPQWQAHAALAPAEEAGTGAISVLNAAVPPSFVRSDPDRYLALVLDWCARLKPMHGLAGFAPVYGIGAEADHMQETWPFLARFPGLNYAIPYPKAAEGQGARKISGISWLTVLGDEALAALGGRALMVERLADTWALVVDEAPRPGLPPGISLHDYDGGSGDPRRHASADGRCEHGQYSRNLSHGQRCPAADPLRGLPAEPHGPDSGAAPAGCL
jgi:hypothetical protein